VLNPLNSRPDESVKKIPENMAVSPWGTVLFMVFSDMAVIKKGDPKAACVIWYVVYQFYGLVSSKQTIPESMNSFILLSGQ
jgi:hypothetical protein